MARTLPDSVTMASIFLIENTRLMRKPSDALALRPLHLTRQWCFPTVRDKEQLHQSEPISAEKHAFTNPGIAVFTSWRWHSASNSKPFKKNQKSQSLSFEAAKA